MTMAYWREYQDSPFTLQLLQWQFSARGILTEDIYKTMSAVMRTVCVHPWVGDGGGAGLPYKKMMRNMSDHQVASISTGQSYLV
jgi:hypothetical protein